MQPHCSVLNAMLQCYVFFVLPLYCVFIELLRCGVLLLLLQYSKFFWALAVQLFLFFIFLFFSSVVFLFGVPKQVQ